MDAALRTALLARSKGVGPQLKYLGQQWFSNQSTGAAATAYTYHQTFTVERKGDRIRFVLLNTNTSPMVISGASCAPSSSAAAGAARYTPSASWTPMTWDGGSTGVTISAGATDLPARKVSDWVSVQMLDRTDGGTLPVVMARFELPTGPFSIGAYSMSPWNALTGINNGRMLATYRDAGAFATANQGAFPGTVYANPFLAGFEVETTGPTVNFLISGDSIDEGVLNAGGGPNFGNGMWWLAISALRTANPGVAIGYINNADGGSQTVTFRTRLDRFIASGLHADALCHSAFSPNDGTPALARNDLMKARLDALLADFSTMAVMLRTPAPNTSSAWDAAADAYRLDMRSYILGRASSRIRTADIEAALSNGATPARFASGKSDDGTHPNDTGCAPCAAIGQPLLQQILEASLLA